MIATAKKYDVICFQLRNNLCSQLESPLRKDLNQLSSDIKAIITSGKKIQAQSVEMLSQVFNFRIKALRWLADDRSFDYLEMFLEKNGVMLEEEGIRNSIFDICLFLVNLYCFEKISSK